MEVTALKVQLWPLDKIKPYEKNVKVHDSEQVKKIAESIQKFGWDQPIVVDKDGVIIKGHGRTAAAKLLGLKQVPVLVRSDLSPDEVKAARIADNRVALGDIDTSMLQEELRGIDIDLTGIFDEKELKFLDEDLPEVEIEDEAEEEPPQEPPKKEAEPPKKDEEEYVSIAEALGIDKVKRKDRYFLSSFICRLETETQKVGAEALVEFSRNYIR